jgi:hypothetical protein
MAAAAGAGGDSTGSGVLEHCAGAQPAERRASHEPNLGFVASGQQLRRIRFGRPTTKRSDCVWNQ